jgi:hypothetical protein
MCAVSAKLQPVPRSGTAWPRHAVFALDRWLRKRLGIYEYTASPECLFRIQRCRADQTFVCGDRVCVRRGDPILTLHLWNEHMPAMGRRGPTIAWARCASRAVDVSLRELAYYLRLRPEYDNIPALYGDMCVSTHANGEQLARIAARYGFEARPRYARRPSEVLHRAGESILNSLLVLATNPATLHGAILRPCRQRLIYSRAALERRYLPPAHRSPQWRFYRTDRAVRSEH